MKMIVNVILVVLAFSWISGVSAEKKSGSKSPESIVTCAADATSYLIYGESISENINAGQCKTWSTEHDPDKCSPCISSLENQGCKIVDTVVGNTLELATVTYLLSCIKP